jgi:hypothetical protein
MGATQGTPPRRARRILSLALAGLLALGGGAALALAGAQPASAAPGDVTNDILENTPITHSPFLFQGTASPGDAVTVDSGGLGPDCHAIADGAGNWVCNVVFTDSSEVTVVTASRDTDDGNPATQESEGWEYPVSLPVTITENQPGRILSNANPTVVEGSGGFPGALMTVTIGGFPCPSDPVGSDGSWTCTGPGLPDGDYPVVAQQEVGGALSDPVGTTYTVDTTVVIPAISSPYDSTLPPINIQTSASQPVFSGVAGTAEPFSTPIVLVSDFGTTPIAHPNGGAFDFYCSTTAASDGSWSCQGAVLDVGHFYEVSVYAQDLAGNTSPSPDDEFGIEIVAGPDAPVVFNPQPNFGELSPFVANGTVDGVTTSVRIREGATDLCGVILPAGGSWSCPGVALAPGPHTLSFDAFDMYGTSATTTVDVDSWAQPTITYPGPGAQTSASTIDITGTAPIGADLSVRVDGSTFLGCNLIPAAPTYSCTTGFLPVGPHTVDVDYTDPWGTASATVNRAVTIVPTLPAPTFIAPSPGYQGSDRRVEVRMALAPEGIAYVREGSFNLCPPTPVGSTTYSCLTTALSVGTHNLTISQTDQFGVMSATAHRTITILPTPGEPLTMKTFEFTFQVLGEDGQPIGEAGVGTGDVLTIVASDVPPGTKVGVELHSDPVALGDVTVGQSGQFQMTAVVPAVPPGAHQIVVSATAPGYWPGTVTTDVTVHGLKQIPGTDEVDDEPLPEKHVGSPAHGTGGPGGGTEAHGFTDPTVFGSSVDSPFDPEAHAFALTAAGIVLSGSIAIAFLLLVGFPAELLESTIRSNYDRAFGWLGRLRQRLHRMLQPVARALAHPRVGTALTVVAAAFLLGFADPDFGVNGASVRLLLAMVISVAAINIGLSLLVMRVARRAYDVSALLKPMPAALAIVAVSVLVSRLAGISPGFLFGIVLGVTYARELRLRDEARLGVLGVGLTIAAGVLAWLGYGLASLASGPGFFNNLLIETLAAITLEALGTLVIALLPIEFLDGRTIFRWSKAAWAGLYLVTLLVFLFVVVPLTDNWGVASAPIFGWGTLFVVFALVAVVTWALFRRRPRATASSPAGAGPRRRARR